MSTKTIQLRDRRDLAALPGFQDIDESSDLPCVWENQYRCEEDDVGWTDTWSCMCDDECPECGKDYSPVESVWIGPSDRVLRGLWEALPEISEDAEHPVSIPVELHDDGTVTLCEWWAVVGIEAPEVVPAGPWPHLDAAMRLLVPDLGPRAVVFAVDAGMPDSPNATMTAGVISDGVLLEATAATRSVAKEWLQNFAAIWSERNIPPDVDDQAPTP